MIHLDGDHTYTGALHDMELAVGHCQVRLVDDLYFEEVRNAAACFLEQHSQKIVKHGTIPTLGGLWYAELK